jgi:hypothetical protein
MFNFAVVDLNYFLIFTKPNGVALLLFPQSVPLALHNLHLVPQPVNNTLHVTNNILPFLFCVVILLVHVVFGSQHLIDILQLCDRHELF